MTTLLMATADLPIPTGDWYTSTTARTGSKSFYHANAYSSAILPFYLPIVTPSAIYWRTCYRNTNKYKDLYGTLRDKNNNTLFSFRTGSLNSVKVYAPAGLICTILDVLTINTWYVLEIHMTESIIQVRMNGVEVFSGSGYSNSLTDLATIQYIGDIWGGCLDDIVLCTDDWPGLGGLHVMAPEAVSTPADWDGALPTLSTPGSVVGTQHKFTVPDVPATAIIHRASVVANARVDNLGYGGLKLIHGTTVDSNPVGLSTSARLLQTMLPVPLTVEQYNALEIGVQSG